MSLTSFTGLDAAVMRDKRMSAPAGHGPIFRHFLGASEAALVIGKSIVGVAPSPVADDQGVPVVFHGAPEGEAHGVVPNVMIIDHQKPFYS